LYWGYGRVSDRLGPLFSRPFSPPAAYTGECRDTKSSTDWPVVTEQDAAPFAPPLFIADLPDRWDAFRKAFGL